MKYKLKLPEPLTIEALKCKIDNGYRFKVFQYCFSPIFATYCPFGYFGSVCASIIGLIVPVFSVQTVPLLVMN